MLCHGPKGGAVTWTFQLKAYRHLYQGRFNGNKDYNKIMERDNNF